MTGGKPKIFHWKIGIIINNRPHQESEIAKDPRLFSVSAGYDLSLLASCNHTIQSHGSSSFWAGFLAGGGRGKRMVPRLYKEGRKDPLSDEHQLPRFYYIEGSSSSSNY